MNHTEPNHDVASIVLISVVRVVLSCFVLCWTVCLSLGSCDCTYYGNMPQSHLPDGCCIAIALGATLIEWLELYSQPCCWTHHDGMSMLCSSWGNYSKSTMLDDDEVNSNQCSHCCWTLCSCTHTPMSPGNCPRLAIHGGIICFVCPGVMGRPLRLWLN